MIREKITEDLINNILKVEEEDMKEEVDIIINSTMNREGTIIK